MLDPDEFDEEFPLGDGVVECEAEVRCPYCGETNAVVLDPGGGSSQEYIEDCQVCCRPWRVIVEYDEGGRATVTVESTEY
jgi:hypothetical protein